MILGIDLVGRKEGKDLRGFLAWPKGFSHLMGSMWQVELILYENR